MNKPLKYFAFISYKREDEEWAVWLQHELEYYHLPASLNGREDLPKVFRPVFRDIDELKAGNLPEKIHEALASSANLIVICSPRSADSIWVNKEIETFVEIGNEKGINNLDRVFPFIVEGTPHAKDKSQECFPKVLRDLPDDKERIGGNVNESGRDKAFIKVMAGMLPNVSMDMLWNRYERDKAEEERRKREERDNLLALQSRYVAEKALEVMNDIFPYDNGKAACMALEVLPKNLEQPDRPLVSEAEYVLRDAMFECTTLVEIEDVGYCRAVNNRIAVFSGYSGPYDTLDHATGELVRAKVPPESHTIRIYDINTGEKINEYNGHTCKYCLYSEGMMVAFFTDDGSWGLREATTGKCLFTLYKDNRTLSFVAFSSDNSLVATVTDDYRTKHPNEIGIWDIKTGVCKQIIKGNTNKINSLKFGRDLNTLIISSKDGVRIWDIKTGCCTCFIQEENGCYYSYADFLSRPNMIVYVVSHKLSLVKDIEFNTYYDTLHFYNVEEKKSEAIIKLDETYHTIDNIIVDDDYIQIWGGPLDVYDFHSGNRVFHKSGIRHLIQRKEQTFKALECSYPLNKVIGFDFMSLNKVMKLAKEKYRDKALTEEEKKKYYII